MKYRVRRNIFSLKDNFRLEDSEGNVAFRIRHSLIPFTKKAWILNGSNVKLGYVKKKLFRKRTYYLYIGQTRAMYITRIGNVFRNSLSITSYSDSDNYKIEGSASEREFSIYNGTLLVAKASYRLGKFLDMYGLNIQNVDQDSNDMLKIIGILYCCYFIYGKNSTFF